MNRLSTPSSDPNKPLTASMVRRGTKLLLESIEKSSEKQMKYWRALGVVLDLLPVDDYEGFMAARHLVSSAFFEPIHPETANCSLKILRDRGIDYESVHFPDEEKV